MIVLCIVICILHDYNLYAHCRLYAIASQLSPVDHSSGIEHLEAETFSLYCFQTLTGSKGWIALNFISLCLCRIEVHSVGWPQTVKSWWIITQNLWALCWLCTKKSLLFLGHAYQVSACVCTCVCVVLLYFCQYVEITITIYKYICTV